MLKYTNINITIYRLIFRTIVVYDRNDCSHRRNSNLSVNGGDIGKEFFWVLIQIIIDNGYIEAILQHSRCEGEHDNVDFKITTTWREK